MTDILGFQITTPKIDITGLLSQSWIYIAVIVILTIIGVTTLLIVLFFMTYNKKVEVYENIGGGRVTVRTMKTRARVIKVGPGGEELLKLLRPGVYRTAYGKKIAPNTYAFCIGSDGYWRNITLGDLDTKMGILDIEPIDRDVRMMSVAVEKIIESNYNPNKTLQIVMSIMVIIIFVVAIIAGWIYLGKIGTMTKTLAQSEQAFADIAKTNAQTTQMLINAGYSPIPTVNAPVGLTPAG